MIVVPRVKFRISSGQYDMPISFSPSFVFDFFSCSLYCCTEKQIQAKIKINNGKYTYNKKFSVMFVIFDFRKT